MKSVTSNGFFLNILSSASLTYVRSRTIIVVEDLSFLKGEILLQKIIVEFNDSADGLKNKLR